MTVDTRHGSNNMLEPVRSLHWRHHGHNSVSNHQPHDFYSTVYSDTDQRKYQSSASLAFVRGIHRRPVNSPHKWPVTRKMFPFDDVIMFGEKKMEGRGNISNVNDQPTARPQHNVELYMIISWYDILWIWRKHLLNKLRRVYISYWCYTFRKLYDEHKMY